MKATLRKLESQLPGRVSMPGNDRYVAATAIWAKPSGAMPRAVVHCRTVRDVQSAIRAVRDCDLPLSVRGGGHDWAGRALCDGIVIDLSGMNSVVIDPATHTARISGGARASNVVDAADPLGLAPVTGSVGAVGMAGLTLGGGYGPLIGRFGLGFHCFNRLLSSSPRRGGLFSNVDEECCPGECRSGYSCKLLQVGRLEGDMMQRGFDDRHCWPPKTPHSSLSVGRYCQLRQGERFSRV